MARATLHGLLLAALVIAPCALADDWNNGYCDPSTHQDEVDLHWLTEAQPLDCTPALSLLAQRKDCTLWLQLLTMFKDSIKDLRGTLLVPTDKAVLQALAQTNYDWNSFLALENLAPGFLLRIIKYNFLATPVYTTDAKWYMPPVNTYIEKMMTITPNKWRTIRFVGTASDANAMPDCADQKVCEGVLHITTFPLFPEPLPTKAKPYQGCTTLYMYIAGRGDLQHLKAAIDLCTNYDGQGHKLSDLLNDPRLVATAFIPSDDAFDALVKPMGQQHLEQMPTDFITKLVLNHLVPNRQLRICDIVSGDTLTTRVEYLLASRTEGVLTMYAAQSNAYVTVPDGMACSVIVHSISGVLFPKAMGVPPPFPLPPAMMGIWGNFATLGDLLCKVPRLSGMRDLLQGTKLASLVNDANVLATWFLPTNEALINMAINHPGLTTSALLKDPRARLNFCNYHVLPFSSMPEEAMGDNTQFQTGYGFGQVTSHVVTSGSTTYVAVSGDMNGAPIKVSPDVFVGKSVALLLEGVNAEPLITSF